MGAITSVLKVSPGATSDCADMLLRHPSSIWEGWGTSLAWFGKVLGATPKAEAWADLLFTMQEISTEPLWNHITEGARTTIPCLGLNIVRYNVGGVGNREEEKRSHKSRGWHAEIEGFQPHEGADFDWERDEEQRRFLALAVERGADKVEVFANAPMWWMTDSKSSFGGNLSKPDEFVSYLAEVTAHARSVWNTPVVSLSPFNEPSAGWWKHPHDQEGCNVSVDRQANLIVKLRSELNSRGLDEVIIAASDENTPAAALTTWAKLRCSAALGCVGRINVHAYDGLDPWLEEKHPGVRARLSDMAQADGLPLWMDEWGNGAVDGIVLAKAILEDIHFLKPTAWCYWQLLEHRCSWGLIETEFSPEGVQNTSPPHPKYYVFAHFTRYLRPGVELLHCSEPWGTAGYAKEGATLSVVLLNSGTVACERTLRFSAFAAAEGAVRAVLTQPEAGRLFVEATAEVLKMECGGLAVRVCMPPDAVCSLEISAVARHCGTSRALPVGAQEMQALSAEEVVAMARLAAEAAVAERRHGKYDARTRGAWARYEQCAALASFARHGQEISRLILSSAWGAANERALGQLDADTTREWESFHSQRKRLRIGEDLDWAVFNTTWAVTDAAYYGANSVLCKIAAAKAAEHLDKFGGSTAVVPA